MTQCQVFLFVGGYVVVGGREWEWVLGRMEGSCGGGVVVALVLVWSGIGVVRGAERG